MGIKKCSRIKNNYLLSALSLYWKDNRLKRRHRRIRSSGTKAMQDIQVT